jgi:hypothetical protein
VTELLQTLNERVKAIAGDWGKYTLVGSFLLYVVGYLTLRFHLTAIGIGTDLAVLDERYLFTGARFLVYLVSTVPNLVLLGLPVAALAWLVHRVLPAGARAAACRWLLDPGRLTLIGIVFCVGMIQLVMRQCFLFSDLLLAAALPAEPAWLVRVALDERVAPLFFTALVAGCAVPLAILWALRGAPAASVPAAFGRGLLGFLAAVQLLLLPINYGVLISDKSLARVASLGGRPLAEGAEGWLVWEGKDGMTFLVRDRERKRSLVTIARTEVKQTEIIGFDRILPVLFVRREAHPG